MFRTFLTRISARCADVIDEMLAADFEFDDAPYEDADARHGDCDPRVSYHLEHPHRKALRSERSRRPGRVQGTPAHCVAPIRSAGPRQRIGA